MSNYFTNVTVKHVLVKAVKVAPLSMSFEYDTGRLDTVYGILWSTRKDTITDNGRVSFFQSGAVSGMGIAGFEVTPDNPLTLNDGTSDTVCTTIQQVNTWLITNLT